MWDNVTTMREYAEPTPNAHGRGDMPQTDKVEGEFMKPTAAPVSESKRGNTIMKRTRKTMESSKNNWFDIPDAKFIYHGDWSDPEVVYRGISLNYYDIEAGLLDVYREDHPEDRNDRGFDKWMKKNPREVECELELLYDAEMEYRAEHPEEFEDDDLEKYDESWEGRGLEEKVQDMPDRIDELASQIEDTWISLEDDGADLDKIMQQIRNYVKLSKIDPEEVNMMLGG